MLFVVIVVIPHKAQAFISVGHCYDSYCCVNNLQGFPQKLNRCRISVSMQSHEAVPVSSTAILYLEYITAIIAEGSY